MKKFAAAATGVAFGALSVWFSHRAGSEVMLGLIMVLLLVQGFYGGSFRNEVRHRLDEIQNVPELLRTERESSE